MKRKLHELEAVNSEPELRKLKIEMETLQEQEEEWKNIEGELMHKEKMKPWNIDTICKEGKSNTVCPENSFIQAFIFVMQMLNKAAVLDSNEKKAENDSRFYQEKFLKKFVMVHNYEDIAQFLIDHPNMVYNDLANWLTLYCLDLEIDGKHDLADQAAHQTVCIQFLLELAKTMQMDPRGAIRHFFSKMKSSEVQYLSGFQNELQAFRQRIKVQAKEKREQLVKSNSSSPISIPEKKIKTNVPCATTNKSSKQ